MAAKIELESFKMTNLGFDRKGGSLIARLYALYCQVCRPMNMRQHISVPFATYCDVLIEFFFVAPD